MELTKSQIEAINKECRYGQGIFKEPLVFQVALKNW